VISHSYSQPVVSKFSNRAEEQPPEMQNLIFAFIITTTSPLNNGNNFISPNYDKIIC